MNGPGEKCPQWRAVSIGGVSTGRGSTVGQFQKKLQKSVTLVPKNKHSGTIFLHFPLTKHMM